MLEDSNLKRFLAIFNSNLQGTYKNMSMKTQDDEMIGQTTPSLENLVFDSYAFHKIRNQIIS